MSRSQPDRLPRRLAAMLRRRGGLMLAALICGVLVYAIVDAFGFTEEARRVPLVIGVPAALAALGVVVKELVVPTEPAADDTPGAPETPGAPQTPGAPEYAGDSGAPGPLGALGGPDSPASTGVPAGEGPASQPPPATPARGRISTVAACAWILVLALMFLFLGLLVTAPLFIVGFMRVYGREPWPTVLLTTAVGFGLIYLFFIRLLGVQVFDGWVRIWLGW